MANQIPIMTLNDRDLISHISKNSIDVLTPIKESYGEYTRNKNIPNEQNLLLQFIYNTLLHLGRTHNLLFLDNENNIKRLRTNNTSVTNRYIVGFNVIDKEETNIESVIIIDCNEFVSSYRNYNMFIYKHGTDNYTDTNTYFIITLNKISLTQADNLYTIFSKFTIFTRIKQDPYHLNDNIYDIEYLITPSIYKLILNEEEKNHVY
jgi:hypothetical protein